MKSKKKTAHTKKDRSNGNNDSFDCCTMMKNFQKMFTGQSQENDSFDCCTMMKQMCCGVPDESGKQN